MSLVMLASKDVSLGFTRARAFTVLHTASYFSCSMSGDKKMFMVISVELETHLVTFLFQT